MTNEIRIPEYTYGDEFQLRLYVRHKRHIEMVAATFLCEIEEEVRITVPVPLRARQPKLYGPQEGPRTSVFEFNVHIANIFLPGVYRCVSLEAHHPTTLDSPEVEQLEIPSGLQFRVFEVPTETPKVVRWEWQDPFGWHDPSERAEWQEPLGE